MEIIYSIISILILVAMVVIYILYKRGGKGAAESGKNMGKTDAAAKPLQAAKRFALLNGYTVLQDVHIAKDGKFADFDFAIVGVFGVLCVKCVGLGGEIYGAEKDEKWLQVLKADRTYFENPMESAQKGTRLVRDCLFTHKLKNTPVSSAVVFTNSKASIAVGRSVELYNTNTFKALINKAVYTTDKNVDVEKTVKAIDEFIIKSEK